MKSTRKRWILVIVLLISVAALLFAVKEYFRKPAEMEDIKADWAGSAEELSEEFRKGEEHGNKRFLGKIVQVSGSVNSISSEGDSIFNITIGQMESGNVSCTMSPSFNEKVRNLRTGDRVSVRGECAGFLSDVELNRCVLVK